MSKGRVIRCYDYVNHPYEDVRDALSNDALAVFQKATKSAASRAVSVAAELRVNVGGVEVATDIAITIKSIEHRPRETKSPAVTVVTLEWEAAQSPHLFPFMHAELAIYPITATETQLDFSGTYQAPLGALGSVVDAIVGYRIADAAIHRFVNDVATYLRQTLT